MDHSPHVKKLRLENMSFWFLEFQHYKSCMVWLTLTSWGSFHASMYGPDFTALLNYLWFSDCNRGVPVAYNEISFVWPNSTPLSVLIAEFTFYLKTLPTGLMPRQGVFPSIDLCKFPWDMQICFITAYISISHLTLSLE